jgi:hypothetical protein
MHIIKGTPLATFQKLDGNKIFDANILLTDNISPTEADHTRVNEENKKILHDKLLHLNNEDRFKYEELILHKYKDVFEPLITRKGTTHIEHKINTQDATPQRRRGYKIPYAMQPHADKLIKVKLESQTITPSFSPWSSGIVLVPKRVQMDP